MPCLWMRRGTTLHVIGEAVSGWALDSGWLSRFMVDDSLEPYSTPDQAFPTASSAEASISGDGRRLRVLEQHRCTREDTEGKRTGTMFD